MQDSLTSNRATPRRWLNANAVHESFPIHFRRPDIRVAEIESLRPRYPVLLVITHALSRVKSNGLPESDYNLSLEALDCALLEPFDDESSGLVAVVETFAGKRTYYLYIDASFDAEGFEASIRARYADAQLAWERNEDRGWRVFRGYARDFQFP